MNKDEQKLHHRVTDALDKRLDAVELVLADQIDTQQRHHVAIDAERTHRLRLAEEQRGYVDQADKELGRQIDALQARVIRFETRSLWGRLRWLAIGR